MLGMRYQSEQATAARNAGALALVTASDAEVLRLAPAAGTPDVTHGHYTDRPGTPMAVLSLSYFPPTPAGEVYQGWVRHRGTWRSLGIAHLDASGHAVVITEGAELDEPPEAVQVTLEPAAGSSTPTGPVIIAWPGS